MSALEEISFLQHLTDIDSVEFIVREGVHPDILPSDEARQVYQYALTYYFDSGKTRAVTPAALGTFDVSASSTLLDVLESIEINIEDDPELSIADTIEKLKGRYILRETQTFNRSFATLMSEASVIDRLKVASSAASELMTMVSKLTPTRVQVDARQGIDERIEAYEERTKGAEVGGLSLGAKEVDQHLFYVHPGEVAVLGGFAKIGKSEWSVISALSEWRRARTTAVFSLENPLDMTLDRICCAAVSVDSTRWQRGQCDEGEVQRVKMWRDQFHAGETTIHVLHPPAGQRTVQFMMRQAQVLDADSVIIDQLSHIEHPAPRNKPRWEVVRDIMQELKLAASTGTPPLPVLLLHQISRDGKKNADKRGFHLMEDFAESSEVERSADFALMMFQSPDMKTVSQALLQLVAARRVDTRNWNVDWHPSMGHVRVRGVAVA